MRTMCITVIPPKAELTSECMHVKASFYQSVYQ